jgi:LysM repeat protein
LPVADTVVALVEPDRRTITAPDGSFRFDGVAGGPVQVVYGPAPRHVPQSAPRRIAPDGLDLGLVALPPSAAPQLVTPEYGGVIPGCGDTRLSVTTGALAEPTELRLTCVDEPVSFPAPPPAGRLPLVVLDLAPHGLDFEAPAELEVDLPAQPRFADGVALDLMRLDLYRLSWEPAGTITVTANGALARGPVEGLGSFIVAAPPFGALPQNEAAEPQIPRYGVSNEPGGSPVTEFGPAELLIFADFEYAGMNNTPVSIRTNDDQGNVVYESSRPYSASGSDSAPMYAPNGRWPAGRYHTVIFVGEPPKAIGPAVTWQVLASPPAAPTARVQAFADTVPSGGIVPEAGLDTPPGAAIAPPLQGCPLPKGWLEYYVRQGDTLSSLAVATGSEVSRLVAANCLKGPTILVGQRVFLPNNPFSPVKPKPVADPRPTVAQPGLPQPPITGPAATPLPAKPRDPVQPTLAPPPPEYSAPPVQPAAPPPAAAPASAREAVSPPSGVGAGSVPPTPEPTKARAPAEPTLASRPTIPAP